MERQRPKIECKFTFYRFNLVLFVAWFFCSFLGNVGIIRLMGKTFGLSTYLSALAFPCFFVLYLTKFRKKHQLNRIGLCLVCVFSLLLFESLGTALYFYTDYQGLFNTNTISVWALQVVKYLYDLYGVFYAICMLYSLKTRNWKSIKTAFYIFVAIWILFGAFQFLVFYLDKPALTAVYDKVNFLGVFASSSLLARIRHNYGYFRFYGISPEPSGNAILMVCFMAPIYGVLFWQIWKEKIKSKIEIVYICLTFLIYLFFMYLTKSSSVYSAFAVFVLFYLAIAFYFSELTGRKKAIILVAVGLALLVSILIMSQIKVIADGFRKLFDFTNQSTLYRYSTVYNDLLIFARYPLFGCGDGNQGYFYFDNLADTVFARSGETQEALMGQSGLLNGGPTCPAYLSGYGLFGIVVGYFFFGRIYKERTPFVKSSPENSLIWASAFVLFILFFVSSSIHFNASAYVVFGLPFIFHSDIRYTCDEFVI